MNLDEAVQEQPQLAQASACETFNKPNFQSFGKVDNVQFVQMHSLEGYSCSFASINNYWEVITE